MNCSQARAMLAIYRELKQNEKQALEEHIAHCDACRESSTRALFIRDSIRSLPSIEPSADAHDKLMHALAAEHVQYLQKTPASGALTPIPAFLTPYLPELARQAPHSHSLAALSTADTGALPVIKAGTHLRRGRLQMRHFTVVGIAASFLVMMMTTGLLSWLYLANQNQQSTPISRGNAQVIGQAVGQASLAQLKVTADYPNIVSATANNGTIYYSASNSDGSSWALEKFSQQDALQSTITGTSLVSTMDAHQILVLGTSNNWLFWLQMGTNTKDSAKEQSHITSTSNPHKTTADTVNELTGKWSLQSLYIGTAQSTDTSNSQNDKKSTSASTNTQPQTLLSSTFNAATAPKWLTAPIQGITFYQDNAIVAYVDNTGASHLIEYNFDASNPAQPAQATKLADGKSGYVITSPTSNDDGSSIYWSKEWYSRQDGLQSEVWHRQVVAAQPDTASGHYAPHTIAQTYLYSSDTSSFRPQIVNNTLFLIKKEAKILLPAQSKSVTQSSTPGTAASSTPTVTGSVTASPTQQPAETQQVQLPGNVLSVDPGVRTPQIDENITGKLEAFVLNSVLPANTTIDDNTIVTGIHGGASYLIWKDADDKYEMYDARNNVMVNGINDIDRNATFMGINGNSVVWAVGDTSSQDQSNNDANVQVTFSVLNWPR